MAAAVVVGLAVSVAGFSLTNRRAQPAVPAPHPEAVRAYERVRFSDNVGRIQIQTGIRHLQEAIRHDPSFAPAWTKLATAHVAVTWFAEVPARESLEQARKEAQRALQLDPTKGGPWRVLAFVSHYGDWDHITAEAQFRKARELSPDDKAAYSWFAEFLIDLKRFDEAFVYARQAQEVAPRWLEAITVAGNIHLFSGHHELAIAEYQRALEVEPNHGLTKHFLGRAYLAKRQYDKAIDQLRKSNDLIGGVPFTVGDLGYALAVGGRRAEAEQLLSSLIAKREQAYFPAFPIAQIQLGLGRPDAGLDWLERAADEWQMGYYLPTVEPHYDSVRAHPRFRAILRRINLQ
jgi:tetratricopeptide (TPR) repeat protein